MLVAWLAVPVDAGAAVPQRCIAATAASARIETVQADFGSWMGRCVRLSGIAYGWRLLADREALLEQTTGFGEDARRSIILYPGKLRAPSRPMRVEVIGILGSCKAENDALDRIQAAAPDEIIMLGGFCHTSLATYVKPAAIRILSRARIARLTEAELSPQRQTLVEAATSLSGYAERVDAARALVKAIAVGDEAGFVRLYHPGLWEDMQSRANLPTAPWIVESRAEIRRLFERLSGSRRMFAEIARDGASRERVFVDRAELADLGGGDRAPLFLCWCKTPNCTGRWPVVRDDTGDRPKRPYFCVRSSLHRLDPQAGEISQVEPATGFPGFSDPDWARSR